jgi:phage tail sheath gpL-like
MASKNISFETIPSGLRKPLVYAEFNIKLALRGLPGNRYPTIIVAQRLSTGTVAANVVADVFDDAQAALYFGAGSLAHQMVRASLQANRYIPLSVVTVDDDAAGIAATGGLAITGTPTASGSVSLWIGPVKNTVAVTPASTPATISAALATAINNVTDLAVTADGVAAAGTIAVTAKNKGALGNQIKLRFEITAPGLTGTRTQMTGGANGPSIATALTAMFNAGHRVIATAFNDAANLLLLRTHVETVSNPFELRFANAWFGSVGTLGNSTTLAAGLNSGRVREVSLRYISPRNTPSVSWELAAAMAAVDAGETDPARPLNDLELVGISPNVVEDWYSRGEQENMLYNGVTPLQIGPGDRVQVVRAITTYTKNAAGADDISLLDITTQKTLDYFAYAVLNDQKLRFHREKITDRVVRAVRRRAVEIAYLLQDIEILRNVKQFEADFVAEIDLQNPNQINLKVPAPVVPGLHILASRFDLYLQF